MIGERRFTQKARYSSTVLSHGVKKELVDFTYDIV